MAINKAQAGDYFIKAAPYILILVIVLIVFNKVEGLFKPDKDKIRRASDFLDAVDLELDSTKLTQTNSVYKNWANLLENAMDGLTTNDSVVESVVQQIKTNDDFRKLLLVFGIRGDENLIGWINDDFDVYNFFGTDKTDLNNLLKVNGVTERF